MTLPRGWALARVEELAGIDGLVTDGDWVETKDQDTSGRVRLTQLADVGSGIFRDRSQRFMTLDAATRLNCTFLAPGDVLIARMPDPIGRACIFPGLDRPAVTAVDVMVWRSDQTIAYPDWFVRCFNSPVVRSAMAAGAGGTTRQRVAGGFIKGFELPVPPLPEQRRIVAKLDALTARMARARAELDRVTDLAERVRLTVMLKAFNGELTAQWRLEAETLDPVMPRPTAEIRPALRVASVKQRPFELPAAWRWYRLPELGELDRGRSRHRPRNEPKLFGGDHPFVQTGDVRAAKQYLVEYSETYSEFGLAQSKKWPSGTVCILAKV